MNSEQVVVVQLPQLRDQQLQEDPLKVKADVWALPRTTVLRDAQSENGGAHDVPRKVLIVPSEMPRRCVAMCLFKVYRLVKCGPTEGTYMMSPGNPAR